MWPELEAASDWTDRASVEQLALTLLTVGADEDVRVLEALAATLVNGCRHSDHGIDCALQEPSTAAFADAIASRDLGRKLPLGRRVARRALRGSLADPTLGATAFHRVDTNPTWSRDLLPVAVIGSFLFYKLSETELAASPIRTFAPDDLHQRSPRAAR
jgi:Cell Wall Hydrolase